MLLWTTHFRTVRPIPSFPILSTICSERIFGPKYEHHGRFRQGEEHSIFKYTLQGEGCFRDAAGEHRLPAGSGFLVEIRDPATSYYYPKDGTEPWTFVWMAFKGETATRQFRDIVARYGAVFSIPEQAPCIRRLLEFRREDNPMLPITPIQAADIVLGLLMALAATRESPPAEQPADLLVRRAQVEVAERMHENLNVTGLARMLGVSREYLTRKFHDQLAITPYEYILRRKMLQACHLLKETLLSAKEISSQLGYPAPAHFTRAFKRVLRMTPRQFRTVGSVPNVL